VRSTNFPARYDSASRASGAEGTVQARVLMVKGYHQHFTERDYDFKRFHAEAQQGKGTKVAPENKP
jgi:hypothetical protein